MHRMNPKTIAIVANVILLTLSRLDRSRLSGHRIIAEMLMTANHP